jgi:uncharacterized membrane protein YeiH
VLDLTAAAADSVSWGVFTWSGDFTMLDLIAATTNALNGALLARRPDHYKNFTIVGILLMALIGGMTGGVIRDLILMDVPSAFTNPAYIVLCLVAGVIGYFIAYTNGEMFREGLFQFVCSFSLPWFAIVGASAAISAGLPISGALVLAVISAVAGRYLIDLTCGVPPKLFIQGEWFVVAALLTAVAWIACDAAGMSAWASASIAVAIGFSFRLTALYRGWEEPLAKEPAGVYVHSNGRPLLGRKLQGKSEREIASLGLGVDPKH